MAPLFVPWSESMRADVLAAFGAPTHWTIEQGRSGWRERSDGERWSRAVVLIEAGRPAAVASAFHPEVHPTREWGYVEVAPEYRRRGYGDAALAELRRTLPGHAGPLRSKVRAGSPGERFALRRGLQPIQRTRTVRVTVPEAPPAFGSGPGATLAKDAVFDDAIAGAWRRYYTSGHAWDPPVDLSADRCRDLFLRPADHVVLASTDDDVVGVALVWVGQPAARFVGGAVARDDPYAVEIATRLLVGAAELTVERCLHIELDDWMSELSRAIEPWPHGVVDEAYVMAETSPR